MRPHREPTKGDGPLNGPSFLELMKRSSIPPGLPGERRNSEKEMRKRTRVSPPKLFMKILRPMCENDQGEMLEE